MTGLSEQNRVKSKVAPNLNEVLGMSGRIERCLAKLQARRAFVSDEARLVRRVAFALIRAKQTATRQRLALSTGLSIGVVDRAVGELRLGGAAEIDSEGGIVAVAGLSAVQTDHARHRLTISGETFFTWCAIDAVGIPAALGVAAVVETFCGRCSRSLVVSIEAGVDTFDQALVVWCPGTPCSNTIVQFCANANMFCTEEHFLTWWLASDRPAGDALNLDEVTRVGSALWDEVANPRNCADTDSA